jgi:hypothetical protein
VQGSTGKNLTCYRILCFVSSSEYIINRITDVNSRCRIQSSSAAVLGRLCKTTVAVLRRAGRPRSSPSPLPYPTQPPPFLLRSPFHLQLSPAPPLAREPSLSVASGPAALPPGLIRPGPTLRSGSVADMKTVAFISCTPQPTGAAETGSIMQQDN